MDNNDINDYNDEKEEYGIVEILIFKIKYLLEATMLFASTWSWQITILLFIIDSIASYIGLFSLSTLQITFFLWFPFIIIVCLSFIIYTIGLIYGWFDFFEDIIAHLKNGFLSALKKQ